MCGINTDTTLRAVIDHIVQLQLAADLAVVTGDIAQQPAVATYTRFATHLQRLSLPGICIAGNHDEIEVFKQLESNHCQFYTSNRVVKRGQWWFVLLNTAKPHCVEGYLQNKQWLRATLKKAATDGKHVAIWMHHNPLLVGCAWLDQQILREADWFVNVITEFKTVVKGIFHGHVHQEFEGQIAGVRVWATPSTCFQFAPQQQRYQIDNICPGFRVVELHDDGSVVTQVLRINELPEGLELDNQGYGSN